MIYIKEFIPDKNSVAIRPEGILDHTALPILESVLKKHIKGGKKILMDLGGLVHVSREAKDFLQELQGSIIFISSMEFKKLEGLDWEKLKYFH